MGIFKQMLVTLDILEVVALTTINGVKFEIFMEKFFFLNCSKK